MKKYSESNKQRNTIHIKRISIKIADPIKTHNAHRKHERDIHDILPRHMHRLVLRMQPAQEGGRRCRQPPVVPMVRMAAMVVVVAAVVITPAVFTRRGSGAGQRGQAAVCGVFAVDLEGIGVVLVPFVRQLCWWIGLGRRSMRRRRRR